MSVHDKTGVFISYAAADRHIAEKVALALEERGYSAFWDRTSLLPGAGFNLAIEQAIADSELMVVLVSAEAVERGCYVLTELKLAREKWGHPDGRVLPVLLPGREPASLPPFLAQCTPLRPEGNLEAEVALAASRLLRRKESKTGRSRERVSLETIYQGHRIEAVAGRTIQTTLELRLDGHVVALVRRPWVASLGSGVLTLFGFKPRWKVETECRIRGAPAKVRLDLVTTFANQYFELFIDGEQVPV
jgi:hypothetical protein